MVGYRIKWADILYQSSHPIPTTCLRQQPQSFSGQAGLETTFYPQLLGLQNSTSSSMFSIHWRSRQCINSETLLFLLRKVASWANFHVWVGATVYTGISAHLGNVSLLTIVCILPVFVSLSSGLVSREAMLQKQQPPSFSFQDYMPLGAGTYLNQPFFKKK